MELLFHPYGSVKLNAGKLPSFTSPSIPGAQSYYLVRDFVEMHLEKFKAQSYELIYSQIRPARRCTIKQWFPLNYLTSLLVLKGNCLISLPKKPVGIGEGEFALFRSSSASMDISLFPSEPISLLFTIYRSMDSKEWIRKIAEAENWVKNVEAKNEFTTPRLARHTVLGTIHEIFTEDYQAEIRQTIWRLKLEESLVTQVADVFLSPSFNIITAAEKELAKNIRNKIEKDIAKHFTIQELSQLLNASESSLKRAFSLVYKRGIYEHLISLRMMKAKELLLQGHLVKTVALSVGMRPSNFTTEFRKFFGYNASSLQK